MEVILILLLLMAAMSGTTAENYKRVCYYSNWSQYRLGIGKFLPSDIPADLCTHLIYSFAKLNRNYELAMTEWNDKKIYADFNDLKNMSKTLKTSLAVGGWIFGSRLFTKMVSDPALRMKFATTSVTFLRGWNFDGLDLDWEYPAQRGGVPSDKRNYVKLLKDLTVAFNKDDTPGPRLLLTAAVPAGKGNIDPGYNIPKMNKYLDFINLMSYDLHGGWEKFTGHNSPLLARPDEIGAQRQLNVDWAAKYWASQGVHPSKLIIGLATYGRGFQLNNSANHDLGDVALGAGSPGPITGENGFWAYYEICSKVEGNTGIRYWDEYGKVPYYVEGNQWIGYDDYWSFIIKLNYIRNNNYGGAMIWNIDLDDFNQVCKSSTRRYPLMSLMKEVLGQNRTDAPPQTVTPPPTVTLPHTVSTSTPPTVTQETNAPPTSTNAPPTSTNGPPTSTTVPPTACPTNPATDFSCAGRDFGFYKDDVNCQRYYQCYEGNVWHMACSNDLIWSQAKMYCDSPSNIKCCSQPTNPPPSTNTPTHAPTDTPTHTTTDAPTYAPTDTTTDAPIDTSTDAPIDAPTDAPTNAKSDAPARSPTNEPSNFCAGKANGLYRKADNCKSFYQCAHEVTYVKYCAGSLLFNAEVKTCDWPVNVDCDKGGDKSDSPPDVSTSTTTTTTTTTTTLSLTTSIPVSTTQRRPDSPPDVSTTTTTTLSPTTSYSVSTTQRTKPENPCATTGATILPHPSNCHAYILCRAGTFYIASCGSYLKFNTILNSCDWPDNVQCE